MPATPTRPTIQSAGDIRYLVAESTLGPTLVAATPRGVCAILLGGRPDELVRELRRRFPGAALDMRDRRLQELRDRAVGLVDGTASADLPLDPQGSEFERTVWSAIAAVPAGSVTTYAALASRLGVPRGARAVARACASNTIAIAIPCHRVVRSDGGLAGYRWGLTTKRALLAREAAA